MKDWKWYELEEYEVKCYVDSHGQINPNNINQEDRVNLLKTAVMVNDIELVRECLKINVDISNPILLENAAYYGYYEIVKMLLEKGADPTYNGGWAKEISYIRKHYKTSELINQYLRKYKLNKFLKS